MVNPENRQLWLKGSEKGEILDKLANCDLTSIYWKIQEMDKFGEKNPTTGDEMDSKNSRSYLS